MARWQRAMQVGIQHLQRNGTALLAFEGMRLKTKTQGTKAMSSLRTCTDFEWEKGLQEKMQPMTEGTKWEFKPRSDSF